ncbi:MAG: hypothetical protein AAGI69_02505 [Cyanobacteria bacterium P01_H01_bin.21]
MNIKFAISNAILGMLTLALASYAQVDANGSHHLSDIQAQTCPVFLNDGTAAATGNEQQSAPNEALDLTLLCNSGPLKTDDSERVGTDINNRPSQTPQSETQFDRLPQDRVELGPI